jgi:hypothetical protein
VEGEAARLDVVGHAGISDELELQCADCGPLRTRGRLGASRGASEGASEGAVLDGPQSWHCTLYS